MIFESHAHYDDKRFNPDRDEILMSLASNGISHVINVGADMNSSLASIRLAEQYDFIHAAVGVHPHSADTLNDELFELLEEYSSHPKAVALGEFGLDFHYDYSPRDTQRYWFKQQLALAEKVNLPVIIHSREASAETFDIISESNVRRGVIHCYSGAVPMALEYVKMGFHLGIGGVITFENAKTLADVVDVVPLESILLETDCPYLTPVPHRKQRNDSRFLPYVSQKIAGIKSVSQQEVELITANNASTLFQISIG